MNEYYSELYNKIIDLQNQMQNLNYQLHDITRQNNDNNYSQKINQMQYEIRNMSQTILTLQRNTNELGIQLTPYILGKEQVIPSEDLKKKFDDQQELINRLIKTNKQTQSYLDTIDDSLDSFDEALATLAHENEIMLISLMKLKKEFDSYLIGSIKEKVILTSSLSVILHELITNNVINRDNYTCNFQYVIDEIVNIYKQNGLDLDFKDELATLDGTAIRDDGISIRIPNLKTDNVNISIKEESNIISLSEAKKRAMEKKQFKIKNIKKAKSESVRNTLNENEKPKNNIIDAFDKLKNNVINIDLTKKSNKGDD